MTRFRVTGSAVYIGMHLTAHSWAYSEKTVSSAMTNTHKRKPRALSRKAPDDRSIAPSSPQAAPSAAKESVSTEAPTAPGAPPRKFPTRKRVRIGDALRRRGLDEWTIAEGYVDVVSKLTRKSDSSNSVEKLFVDVLKECSRHLEPPQSDDSDPGAPVIVRLVHAVSRPVREKS